MGYLGEGHSKFNTASDLKVDGDANVTGSVDATSYTGDGSSLTGINTDLVGDTTPQLGGDLDVGANALTSSGNIEFQTSGQSTNTHSFIYNEAGGEMHLRNSSGGGGAFFDYGGTFGTRLLNNATTGDIQIGQAAVNTAGNIKFMGAGYTERMRIDSSGKVGIGTTSPSTYDSRVNDLVVGSSGDAGITIFADSGYSSRINFALNGQTGLSNGLIGYNINSDLFVFEAAGSEMMRLYSNGQLLLDGEGGSSIKVDVRQGSAKSWIFWQQTGTQTIRDSYNVSSIADDGTGETYVYYNNDFNNADSSPVGSSRILDSSLTTT